ncbi:unnamed protein product [Periconia digitata]|uniref:DUF2293 domain-containing protein n=1 Tax=Periconia digitata TaxID=1303443 RepID=A0A9W4XL63_9PLEO|nr:unnamed protein product [Periconia digitata]
MTRVHRASSHNPRDRQRSVRKKKDFKVVLEAVTEQKRKLHTVSTYVDRPPKGYGFIPVGFGEFTDWCREQCRQRGRDVHIVSAAPHNRSHADPTKLSSHVHRIGYHFPLDVIEPACKLLQYKFSLTGGLEKLPDAPLYGDAYFERRFADYYEKTRNALHGRPTDIKENKEYISGAIREMFPNIPDADLESIVNHAFESGTKRVGNAKELTLARRVQLAVVAHIRHQYTEYDNMLKTGTWGDARKAVEQTSVAKLIEWRDEQGTATEELEEVFREVIVLDDDDDSSDDDQSQDPNVDEREVSMEVVSSLATARDLLPKSMDHDQGYAPQPHRSTRRTIYLPSHPVAPYSSAYSSPIVYDTPQYPPTDPRVFSRPLPGLIESRSMIRARPLESRAREPTRAPRPLQMRGSDGQLYTLQPIERPSNGRPRLVETPLLSPYSSQPSSPARQAHEPSRRKPPVEFNHSGRPVLTPASRRASDQDVVLPSIEQDSIRVPDASYQQQDIGGRYPVSYTDAQTQAQPLKRKSLPGPPGTYELGELQPEPQPKRFRPGIDERRHSRHVIDQNSVSRHPMPGPVTADHRPFPQQRSIDLTASPRRVNHVDEGIPTGSPHLWTAGPAHDRYITVPHTSLAQEPRGMHYEISGNHNNGTYVPAHDLVYSGRHPEPIHHAAYNSSRFHNGGEQRLRDGSVYETFRKP